jgi:3-(methylthio)propanoyl-CoA dehydrogenase
MQGIAVSDRAYQQAVTYAKERIQSRDLAGSPAPVAIIHHPDVKRMLLTMRATTEGARALAYFAAAASDLAHCAEDAAVRAEQQAIYEFLVPIIKGYSTEASVDVASLGVQVHGGMGFIEETGAAQHYRDARILPIYEGTTAIQANDFVGRKTVRDAGAVAKAFCARIAATEQELLARGGADGQAVAQGLQAARAAFETAIDYVVANGKTALKPVYAGAVNYLKLAGVVLCGWQMARALLVAQEQEAQDPAFYAAKITTARFYAEALLPQAAALSVALQTSGETVNRMAIELF